LFSAICARKSHDRSLCNFTLTTAHFSADAESLVRKLLHRKPTRRLGVVKGGASQIKKHAWFADTNWKDLAACKTRGPIIPEIKDELDLSNFEEYGEDDDIMEYIDDGSNWEADF
jgi:serine/threonine protein kinase